jgi:hypothetical protein
MARQRRGGFVGLNEMIDECDRLGRGPSVETLSQLDTVLAQAASYSQAVVHVHTGALKASMHVSSGYDESSKTWEGEIRYLDEAAVYELARGGSHSAFIDDLEPLYEGAFEEALLDHFRD